MSAALLTVQSALLILWAELMVVSDYGKPSFVGAVLIAGIFVGVLAVCRAWDLGECDAATTVTRSTTDGSPTSNSPSAQKGST